MRHHAKCCTDRSHRCRDISIFGFFKMAAATISNFRNFKFLRVGTVRRVELHQRAKFRQNRLNLGRDMAIFNF